MKWLENFFKEKVHDAVQRSENKKEINSEDESSSDGETSSLIDRSDSSL